MELEIPFGHVVVAASRTVYSDAWLGLDQELEVTLQCCPDDVQRDDGD